MTAPKLKIVDNCPVPSNMARRQPTSGQLRLVYSANNNGSETGQIDAQNADVTTQTPAPGTTTLVIGDTHRWAAEGRNIPQIEGFIFISFHQLTAEVIAKRQPGIVLSPLVTEKFDAIDVARVLLTLRYHGPYRAVSDELPSTKLVRRDVLSHAPGLDFDVLNLSTLPGFG